jgi:hypothetical protein
MEREEDTEEWKEKRTGEAPTPRENPLLKCISGLY